MKTKKLIPRNVAPVKRDTTSKTSAPAQNIGDISPHLNIEWGNPSAPYPFAGDDAE